MTAVLILAILFIPLIGGDNTTFQQRREEAQKRAENYNNAVYSGEQRATDEEVAAAIKNFNPEVESEYVENHADLKSSFVLLNSIEKNWNFSSFERNYSEDWDAWMLEGEVGAYAP